MGGIIPLSFCHQQPTLRQVRLRETSLNHPVSFRAEQTLKFMHLPYQSPQSLAILLQQQLDSTCWAEFRLGFQTTDPLGSNGTLVTSQPFNMHQNFFLVAVVESSCVYVLSSSPHQSMPVGCSSLLLVIHWHCSPLNSLQFADVSWVLAFICCRHLEKWIPAICLLTLRSVKWQCTSSLSHI